MDASAWKRVTDCEWRVEPTGKMRVPIVLYADEALLAEMDDKVLEQARNVATLPGIVRASYVMPDGHWGYGFPIGGVAAFDPERGGVVSAGGVGFDISCGVRTLTTGLKRPEVEPAKEALVDALFHSVPCGVGRTGRLRLSDHDMEMMLSGGARWAVHREFGLEEDLERIEERGCMAGADPACVSARAKERQREEIGTLGSGNHYLELQYVAEVHDLAAAAAFGLASDDVVVTIHCGSRGLGHQIGTDYLREMVVSAPASGLELPDRELACAPIRSDLGRRYLGAMRAATNCAFANRQVITHIVRLVFAARFPRHPLRLLFDVSHNTCKEELHQVDGERRTLFVHRKGATRAFGPGHPDLPAALSAIGQPVLIGGSMGTCSYVLAGTEASEARAFSSACHGAGRNLSRHEALRRFGGSDVVRELAQRGILVRSPSRRGVAEEAPGAYKDVARVVDAAHRAGLARKVARLLPLACVKG
jgi:tRNA-splicing ligase RtcB